MWLQSWNGLESHLWTHQFFILCIVWVLCLRLHTKFLNFYWTHIRMEQTKISVPRYHSCKWVEFSQASDIGTKIIFEASSASYNSCLFVNTVIGIIQPEGKVISRFCNESDNSAFVQNFNSSLCSFTWSWLICKNWRGCCDYATQWLPK